MISYGPYNQPTFRIERKSCFLLDLGTAKMYDFDFDISLNPVQEHHPAHRFVPNRSVRIPILPEHGKEILEWLTDLGIDYAPSIKTYRSFSDCSTHVHLCYTVDCDESIRILMKLRFNHMMKKIA